MRFHREDSAQAIVLIAIVTSVLLLGVGVAIDTGQLYAGRRAVQTAADSAAWAGAVVIHTATSANAFTAATRTAAEAAAVADALRNGYTITAAADVNTPPTTGPVREDPGFVEVIITTNVQPAFFPGPRPVTVRAVAGATRSGSGNAVHILRGVAIANALNLAGAARLDVTGGDVRVNSSDNGGAINIATGGITTPGFATRAAGNPGISAGDAARVVPVVVPSQVALADPFLGLPGPSTSALWGAAYGIAPAVLAEQGTIDRNNNNTPLSQGIYTGGIRLRGTSNVTFNPGVYILRGGGSDFGLTVSNSAQINMASATAGVVIYNTYSNYPAAPGGSPNCGRIDFDTTGQLTLRPATAGSYAGIVIIQDPSCPTGDTMRIRNTGARNITGTIYLPNTNLSITSTGAAATLNLTGQFVVWQYDSNPTDVNLTFAPATSAGSRVPALVE